MPRYLPEDWQAKAFGEQAGLLLELYEFEFPSGTRYWGKTAATWRGQTYAAMVDGPSGAWTEELNGAGDQLTVDLFNVDGTVRALIDADEFLDCIVRARWVDTALANSDTPAWSGGTLGNKVCTVGVIKPQARDAKYFFTKNADSTTFAVRSDRSEDLRLTIEPTATVGVEWTSADGNVKATITGTYVSGDSPNEWSFRVINSMIVFEGPAQNPEDASQRIVSVTVNGYAELLRRSPVPRRQFLTMCHWVFGALAASLGVSSPCGGGLSPFTTASGSGTASIDLVVASVLSMASAKGRSIVIGAQAAVTILAINETTKHVTLSAARTWASGASVTYADCRHTMADCQDASRTHEYGGFLGFRSVKGVLQRRAMIEEHRGHSSLGVFAANQFFSPFPLLPIKTAGESRSRMTANQFQAGLPVPFTDDPIPLIYGRRLSPLIPIEMVGYQDDEGRPWRAVFYAVCAGPLDDAGVEDTGPVSQLWIEGRGSVHRVQGAASNRFATQTRFQRLGLPAVDDTESNFEYNEDSDTLVRPQNRDYQSNTGTAFNLIAYIVFRKSSANENWPADHAVPEAKALVQGRSLHTYSAYGVDLGLGFNTLPPFQLVDLLTDEINGAGLPVALFDMRRTALAQAYCGVYILSVESQTVVTGASAGQVIAVRSAAGWKPRQKVYKNGVDTGLFVLGANSGTEIRISAALSVVAGDALSQYTPRFESNLRIKDRQSAFAHLPAFLVGCRGYLAMTQGLIAVDVDREVATERMPDTRHFENFTGGVPDGWGVSVTGSSDVFQDSFEHSGISSCDLHIDGGYAEVQSDTFDLEPGYSAYVLSFWAYGYIEGQPLDVRIKETTSLKYLGTTYHWTTDGSTAFRFTLAAGWQHYSLTFCLDPHITTGGYSVRLRGTSDGPGVTTVTIDEVSVFGPCGGEWRDVEVWRGQQRFFLLGGEEHFKAGPGNPDREVNEVKVSFVSEFQGSEHSDAVPVRDYIHQATHPPKEKSLSAPGLMTADEAVRIGKYELNRSRLLGPGATTDAFLAGILAAPGDVVVLSHQAPGWTRRTHRLLRNSMSARKEMTLEAEHWDPAVYTDAGEPSEFGAGTGLPVVTLTEDAYADRKWELSWTITGGNVTARYYDIYVSLSGGLDPADLDDDLLVRSRHHYRSYTYRIPLAMANQAIDAVVVAVLMDGREVASQLLEHAIDLDAPIGTGTVASKLFTNSALWITTLAEHRLAFNGLTMECQELTGGKWRPIKPADSYIDAATGDAYALFEQPETGRMVLHL